MKRKVFRLLAGTLILILAMAACAPGGGSSAPNNPSESASESPSQSGEPEKAEGDGIVMSYWSMNLGADCDVVGRITEEVWNVENPKAKVDYQVTSGSDSDFLIRLSTAFAAGEGPDIFTCCASNFLKYVDNGVAKVLNDWVNPNIDDFYPAAIDIVSDNGNIYAYPGNGDLLGLYCNVEMFEEAGLQYPTTWAETLAAAEALAKEDRYGILVQTFEGNGYLQFEHYAFMWMGGGDILAADNKTVTVNSQATIDAFQFYRDIANNPGGCLVNESHNSDITPFATGRTAMQICGSWAIAKLNETPELKYTVVPFPVPKAGMTSSSDKGGWHILVSDKGVDPDKAADYVTWVYNNEDITYMSELCEKGVRFSPRKSVIEQAEFFKEFPYNLFAEQIGPIAKMEPRYNSIITKAYGEALEEAIINTDKDVKDIVAELEQKCIDSMK